MMEKKTFYKNNFIEKKAASSGKVTKSAAVATKGKK
jgi:hypothetical protein